MNINGLGYIFMPAIVDWYVVQSNSPCRGMDPVPFEGVSAVGSALIALPNGLENL